MRNKSVLIHEHLIDRAVHVAVITEVFLKDSDAVNIKNTSPPGYLFIERGRKGRKGGGIGVIHGSQWKFAAVASREDSTEFEHLIVRCDNLTVLMGYRPPSSCIPLFLDQFDELVSSLPLSHDAPNGRYLPTDLPSLIRIYYAAMDVLQPRTDQRTGVCPEVCSLQKTWMGQVWKFTDRSTLATAVTSVSRSE